MSRVISIDLETNGLWGDSFAFGAVSRSKDGSINRVSFRCPIDGEVNPWVAENVLPEMEAIEVTHSDREGFLKAIAEWYMIEKEDAQILWHMGHVIETNLFRELVDRGLIGEWDAPYVPLELSMILQMNGFAPDSVDGYLKNNGLGVPAMDGGTHNPLYDSYAALLAYESLVAEKL